MSSFSDVNRMLQGLARRPTLPQQRQARAVALEVVKDEAAAIVQANGNIETRKYLGSFGVVSTGRVSSSVGPIRGKAHATLGHLLEFGTAPHWQPRRQRMHPGSRAFPHWRPAFESTRGELVATLGRHLVGSMFGRST